MAEQRTLRSKADRELLFMLADGRCQICGRELPENWHADHIVPWAVSQTTEPSGMQALCPTCNTSKGKSMTLQPVEGFTIRDGQKKAFEVADTITASDMLLVLPTGYGKTVAAIGVYATLRSRGIVDRLLWLVPTDAQREQLKYSRINGRKGRGSIEVAADRLGIKVSEVIACEKSEWEIRLSDRDSAEAFIATYQQIAAGDQHFRYLLGKRKWMVVYDECHHLGEEGKWGPASDLKRAFSLYLSATPMRSDKQSIRGMPTTTRKGNLVYRADVEVSLQNALMEGAIKIPVAHIEHYFVDVIPEGATESVRIDTNTLREGGIGDFSDYEAKRGLRYCSEYLSRILSDALTRLNQKLYLHPGAHQCLVFAMTCNHAEAVALQFNSLQKGCADWIGVTRSNEENDAVLNRYRDNKLPVLVQVDKAGEGFDNPRVSVLVFLHLIKSETKLFQQFGRGLRRIAALKPSDDTCDIFASADTEIANLVVKLEIDLTGFLEAGDPAQQQERQSRLFDIPELIVVNAEWERTERLSPVAPILSDALQKISDEYGVPPAQLLAAVEMTAPKMPEAAPIQVDAQQSRLIHREACHKALSILSANIVRLISKNGFRADLLGTIKKRVNGRWQREGGLKHDDMTSEEFDAKRRWLKQLNDTIMESRQIPRWLEL